MADRAHIRFVDPDWTLVRKYNGEKGRFSLEDARTVSPVVIGFVDGNDKIVPIERPSTDTSTGSDIVRSVVETIEATRVVRTETIRDMTQQEIDDRGTENLNFFYGQINDNDGFAGFRDLVFRMNQRLLVAEAGLAAVAAATIPPTDLTVPAIADDPKETKGDFNNDLKARIQDQIDTA